MTVIDWLIETWRMPWFTFRLGVESKELTDLLEAIMYFNIQPDEIHETKLVATFTDVNIWLGNYPYASYSIFDDKRIPKLLPSRRTNYRFNKYINKIILGDLANKLSEN